MPSHESPAARLERLLQAGDAMGALRAADEMLVRLAASPVAHLARARALFMLGKSVEGELALDRALAGAPKDAVANTLRANLDAGYGRDAEAIERLRPFALASTSQANEALLVLLDILYHSGRREEWRELLGRAGPWRSDPRAALHAARNAAPSDPHAVAAALQSFLRGQAPVSLRRTAGFEAVTILDRAGDYRGAFDLAREVHATTDGDSDLDRVLRPIEEQLVRADAEGNWAAPRAPKVDGVVLICALPRSGTTLLEQMLDRHPEISGIGEYAGLGAVCAGLRQHPCWPRRPNELPRDAAEALQRLYLAGAARNRRAGARWAFDKNLRTWQSLPDLAAVLPGAACISVERDPRDLATSLYLSHFQHGQQTWTTSLDAIHRTIELSQRAIPRLLEVLEIPHIQVIYEDLVEDPARDAQRALSLLGLAMDERVLAPEGNTRTAMTQSAAQVRRPINRTSVGRWRNYAFAFEGPLAASWDALAAAHDRRRSRG